MLKNPVRIYGYGHLHFIAVSCYRRKPRLDPFRARNLFVEVLDAVRDRHGFALAGYVVMPEHAHLLIGEHRVGSIQSVGDESQKTPTLETGGSGTRKFKITSIRKAKTLAGRTCVIFRSTPDQFDIFGYSFARLFPLMGAWTAAWAPFGPVSRSDLSFEGQLQFAESFTSPPPL